MRRSSGFLVAAAAAGGLLLGGCTAGGSPDDTVSSAPAQDGGGTPTSTSPEHTDGPVSADEAGRIATDEFGGTVKEVESDHADGRPAWEVEVEDSRQGRIEVKVDKETGKILEVESD